VLTDEQVSLPPISSIVSRWDIEPSDVDHSVVKHECCQDLIDTVLDGIRKLGPDLLVVGTHRGRGVVHWLSGSPAVSLARNTDVPTLLLPIGERGLIAREDGNIRLENVLIPVETQEAADTAFDALSKFMDGAGIENATVHLLGAEGKCDLERIRLPRDKEWQFEKHCRVEKLEKAVDALADEVNANLIVMATNGQDSFHDFLWGTHTERVLAHANRPVMSVQMKNGN
jgi:nucleotide-binding universal stress UspA family protein